ncbi:PTS sugar transporter subunit IIA [Streptococcus cameli]
MYKTMLHSDLIRLNCNAQNYQDLFEQIGKELLEKNYVSEQYVESLLKREERFPTGLKTKFLNIALPHTDPEVILEPFIFVVKNRNPIRMLQMGDNSETICQHFLFLGIKDPKGQVGLLSKLMEMFYQEEFVKEFAAIDTESEMYHVLNQQL